MIEKNISREKEIIEKITFISGILELANWDIEQKHEKLKEKDWNKSIKIIKEKDEIEIKLGVVIDAEIKTCIIINEIKSSIKNLLKNEKIKKIKIYIRGIR